MESDDAFRRMAQAAEMLQLAEAVSRPGVLKHLGAAGLADLRSAFRESSRALRVDMVEIQKQLRKFEGRQEEQRGAVGSTGQSSTGCGQSFAGSTPEQPSFIRLERGLQSSVDQAGQHSLRASLRNILEGRAGAGARPFSSSSES